MASLVFHAGLSKTVYLHRESLQGGLDSFLSSSGLAGAADVSSPGNRAPYRSHRHGGSGRSSSAGTQGDVHPGGPAENDPERGR